MTRSLKTLLLAAAAVAATAGAALAETVAVTNARVLTMGRGGEIARGTVVMTDGKITAVGANVAVPAGARVIDAQGKVVTPGLVVADSILGLTEVGALQDTNDFSSSDDAIGASFDVQYGINPDSIVLPVARLGGITRAIVQPVSSGGGAGVHEHDGEVEHMTAGAGHGYDQSGLFAGQAAVIHLGAGPDLVVRPKVAMIAPLGNAGADVAGGARGAHIVELKIALDDARWYARNRAAYAQGNGRELGLSRADLEALIPVVEGRMPLVVSVHRAADIRQALRLAREERVRIIVEGGEEAWRVADELAAARVPVLLNPLTNLPESFETLGSTLDNAARLHRAGVTIAIVGNEGSAHRAREMRWNAGNAVAHGLPWQAALEAITINPARIFGVDQTFGSLEVGKDADVVIWSGDPLEPLTRAEQVFVKGEAMPMTSRQHQLRDRYMPRDTPYPPAYR